MGRGGGGKGRSGGGDKCGAFFTAIESQNIQTVRWSLVYGGISLTTCNDNGETGLMVAAALGRDKAMDTILEQVRRTMRTAADRSECLDAVDGEGQTPLMMAAAGGRLECVKLLMQAGANVDMKDEEGYTARARADWAGKQAVVNALDGLKEESSEDEAGAAESDGGHEGETSTQRSKRKKKEFSGGVNGMSCSGLRNAKKKVEDMPEEVAQAPPAEISSSKPVLQEIADALSAVAKEEKTSGAVKELTMSLIRTEDEQAPGLLAGAMDPALWRCGPSVRHLEIRWRPGLGAGSLDRINALKRILHLVVQDSSLPELPDTLCELQELRSLEVDGNSIATFPNSIKKLSGTLASVSAARCKLTSNCLASLAPLEHLVSLKLDHNKLEDLDDLALNRKSHLVTLSVAHNQLADIPDDPWGDLVMLQHLNISANKLSELPCEMGAMKEKKLTELILHDNPWKDGKIRNMIENSAVLSNTVLVYLRKQKPKGKRQAKAKTKKKEANIDTDSDADSDRAAAICENVADAGHEPEPLSTKKNKKKGKPKAKAAPAPEPEDKDEDEDEDSRRERLAAIEEAKRLEVEQKRVAAAAKRAEKEEIEQKLQQKKIATEQANEAAKLEKDRRDARKIEMAEKRALEEAELLERRSRMTPEELRVEEEQAAIEREQREQHLVQCESERKAYAETQAEQNKLKVEQRERELKEDDAKFKFVFYGGKMHKVRIDGPTPNAMGGKKGKVGNAETSGADASGQAGGKSSGKSGGGKSGRPGDGKKDTMNFEGSIDVPKDLVGRLIGKGGATIKELCTSTGAYINIPKDAKGDVIQVEITGGKKAVDAAVAQIAELLMRK